MISGFEMNSKHMFWKCKIKTQRDGVAGANTREARSARVAGAAVDIAVTVGPRVCAGFAGTVVGGGHAGARQGAHARDLGREDRAHGCPRAGPRPGSGRAYILKKTKFVISELTNLN